MKAASFFPGEAWLGLLVVLVLLWGEVQQAPNAYKTPADEEAQLEVHEGFLYFVEAEAAARRMVPGTSYVWSRAILDKKTGCTLLGHGIWLARGTMSGEAAALPSPPTWAALFVPETHTFLFLRVGNHAEGDGTAAFLLAGVNPAKWKGVVLEK